MQGSVAGPAAANRSRSELSAAFDLPLTAEAAHLARRTVFDLLAGWQLADHEVRDDALLVTSELVTNAVRHGGDRVILELELGGGQLVLGVRDGSASLPEPRAAPDEQETGRGLAILEAVTAAWGVEETVDGGKRVWARLRLDGDPTPR